MNNQNKAKDIVEELNILYSLFENKKNIFEFNEEILLRYLAIQESLPFQNYFKNQFIRFIDKDSLKKHLFLQKEKCNFDLLDSLILKIKNENQINDTTNSKSRSQKNSKNSKDLQLRNKLNSKGKSKIDINPNNKSQENSKNNSTSNISLDMGSLKQKLSNKDDEIDEIIIQKENFLNQIINQNSESKDKRLKYFVDIDNLYGTQFENAGIIYIFELLNCLSVKQDFYFYYNLEIDTSSYNSEFRNRKLNEIGDIQLDFVISDLKIIDLINMLIYLSPNIIDLKNLKKYPFKKGIDF